jgi:hypothetical protein
MYDDVDPATPPMPEVHWNIAREGTAWTADEAPGRWELTPEKFEMYAGKLFWDETQHCLRCCWRTSGSTKRCGSAIRKCGGRLFVSYNGGRRPALTTISGKRAAREIARREQPPWPRMWMVDPASAASCLPRGAIAAPTIPSSSTFPPALACFQDRPAHLADRPLL